MGKNFWAMHHYCWAMINLRRAQAPGIAAAARTHLLGTVAGDYRYVLANTEATFVMRPEILTKLGDVEMMRGNPAAAYHLAETLLQLGQAERARFYAARVNAEPSQVNAQSLWLATRIEHRLGNRAGRLDRF